jgi:hypothetical protein
MLTSSAGYLPLEVPPKQNLYVRKLHLYVRSARVVARLASQAATGALKRFQFLYLLLKGKVSISDQALLELEIRISYTRLRSAKYHCRHVLVSI